MPIVDVWAEYARLRDEEDWIQQEIADAKGVSRTRVGKAISLNDRMPDEIKSIVRQGDITQGHCEELLGLCVDAHFADWLTTKQLWIDIAKKARGFNTRETKDEVDRWKEIIQTAQVKGVNQSLVSERLSFDKFPREIKQIVERGYIDEGHLRKILGISNVRHFPEWVTTDELRISIAKWSEYRATKYRDS